MFTGNYVCTSFKSELPKGVHDFTTHTFRMALYTNSATLDSTTTAYSATNEVSGTGYVAGGLALTGAAVTVVNAVINGRSTDVVVIDFADPVFTAVTLTTRGALIYNDTAVGNPAVAVLDFGSDKVKSGTDLPVVLPPADAVNGLIRIL